MCLCVRVHVRVLLRADRLPNLGLQFDDYDQYIVDEIKQTTNKLKEIEGERIQFFAPGGSVKVWQL